MNAGIKPQWIARMYPGKVGRDHLGLGSVSSEKILPTLSPGINVLTVHPRYYSFYTFLLAEYWQRDLPRSRAAYARFYRPREFIFAVGALLCDQPQHGTMGNINGYIKAGPLARERRDVYDTTFDYIKSDLGGYGLYYRSVMAELGLIYPGGPGFPSPFDVPSPTGLEVAAAFRRAIEHTTYFRDYFSQDAADVPLKVILEYIHRACLCQLQLADASDLPLLRDTFLHGGSPPLAAARRATFRLFTDIAEQTQGFAIDDDAFRQLLYFAATQQGAAYQPQEALAETYQRWRLYQAREYYAFALNALWWHLCDWGIAHDGDMHPLPLAAFRRHLDAGLDFDSLAAQLQIPGPGLGGDAPFQSLLDWLMKLSVADSASFDDACRVDAPVQEHLLYQLANEFRTEASTMVAGMVTMLALIYLRFSHPDRWSPPIWEISRMGGEGRLSLDGFIKALRRRLRGGHSQTTIREVVRWLFDDYIILRHQLVAASKLPDNTYRFQREGERLRFYQLENTLGFMDSRFGALSTMVHELGLCGDFSRPDHPLTFDGMRLLVEGDLPCQP